MNYGQESTSVTSQPGLAQEAPVFFTPGVGTAPEVASPFEPENDLNLENWGAATLAAVGPATAPAIGSVTEPALTSATGPATESIAELAAGPTTKTAMGPAAESITRPTITEPAPSTLEVTRQDEFDIISTLSSLPPLENQAKLGRITTVSTPPAPQSTTFDPTLVRADGDHVSRATMGEVKKAEAKLSQTRRIANFYDEIRGMTADYLNNTHGVASAAQALAPSARTTNSANIAPPPSPATNATSAENAENATSPATNAKSINSTPPINFSQKGVRF